MNEHVMPDLPRGFRWNVRRQGMYVYVALQIEIPWIFNLFTTWQPLKESGFAATQDPEANARSCVRVAKSVYATEFPKPIDVNGLQGAVLGEGVVGNES